ncbi:SpoIIE family protein phosphatase [Micromonosporaceae bacterium Da 78-11]
MTDSRIAGEFAGGSAELARLAFENASRMMTVLESPDLIIRAANTVTRAVSKHQVLGRRLGETMPEILSQHLLPGIREIFETGREFHGQEWLFELQDPAGQPAEMYLTFRYRPLFGDDGRVRAVSGEIVDVTRQVTERRPNQRETQRLVGQVDQARGTLAALQQALLPTTVPILPGLGLGATYLLAEVDTAAGGDWFDTIVLDDDRVALVVGDVVGHGVAASAVMGQLRAVLAAGLLTGDGPAAAVTALDRFAARLPGAAATTVAVVVLDPGTGEFSYCTAGHPSPLLIGADGAGSRYLPPSGSGPLATGAVHRDARAALGDGELLLLYTDGILERPGRVPQRATVELAQIAADSTAGRIRPSDRRDPPALTAHRVCTQTLELLIRLTGHTDDITLLAAQRTAPTAELSMRSAAVPASIATIRQALGRWLAELPLDSHPAALIQHAAGEAVTNVIDHAYQGRPAGDETIEVRARLTAAGRVEVAVTDRGRWREPRTAEPGRGLGLRMAGRLVDRLQVDRHETGTTVTVEHAVHRPVVMLTAADAAPPAPGPGETWAAPFSVEQGAPGGPVVVRGAVDAATAPMLGHQLREATVAGTRSVTVDLDDVTLLTSAAVRVLHEARDACGRHGEVLLLVAAPGTAADHVLRLVALT